MAIVNTQTIAASDLNAIWASTLSSLQTQNQKLPATYWYQLDFQDPTSSDATILLNHNVVMRDDCILAEVVVVAGNHAGTATITVDNGFMIEPLTVSVVGTGATYTKATRNYTTNPFPLQVLTRGSILTVSLATTAASRGSRVQVSLGVRSYWRPSI